MKKIDSRNFRSGPSCNICFWNITFHRRFRNDKTLWIFSQTLTYGLVDSISALDIYYADTYVINYILFHFTFQLGLINNVIYRSQKQTHIFRLNLVIFRAHTTKEYTPSWHMYIQLCVLQMLAIQHQTRGTSRTYFHNKWLSADTHMVLAPLKTLFVIQKEIELETNILWMLNKKVNNKNVFQYKSEHL